MKLPKSILALVPLIALVSLATVFTVGASAQSGHRRAHSKALVKLTAGHLIVNAKGHSLYTLGADAPNKSTCSSQCAKFWPPSLVPAGVKPPMHIKGAAGTFGVIVRSDGKRQLTYDSAPLYRFLPDKKAGDMNGEGVYAFGGFWWPVVANRK